MISLAALVRRQNHTPGAFFATEAEAWEMAARLADETMTYEPAPFGDRFTLQAYDETGFHVGAL